MKPQTSGASVANRMPVSAPASPKLAAKDLVLVGVLGAVAGAVCMVISLLCGMSPVTNPLYAIIAAIPVGIVYMLMLAKVPKHGPIIVTGILVGGVLFVLGMYWSMCLAYCILGVVADLLAGSGNFRNKGRNLLSYMIFVLSPVFPYGMLWFDRDAYVQYLVEKGTEQTYMDTMVSTAQNWMLPAMIIGVLICAAISGLVGQKLLKKHFEKAGVV